LRLAWSSFGGVFSFTAVSSASVEKGRATTSASAPSMTTLAARGLPALRAMATESTVTSLRAKDATLRVTSSLSG